MQNLEDIDVFKKRQQLAKRHFGLFFPRGSCIEIKTVWRPEFSKLRLRSGNFGVLLFAMALTTRGSAQSWVQTFISSLLENPVNAEILVARGLSYGLSKLLSRLGESQRAPLGYILSQLLRYSVTPLALKELLRSTRTIKGVDVVHKINKAPTTKIIADSPESSTNETLFVIGRAVERAGPSNFFYIPLGCPFSTRIELPSIEKINQVKTGFSVCTWLRVGSLGDVPISTFLELSSNDSIRSSSQPIAGLNFFFRVVYKSIVTKETDSVVSGLTGLLGDATSNYMEDSKRSVQLCVSYGQPVGRDGLGSENRWSRAMDQLLKKQLNLGAGGSVKDLTILSSLMRFAVPDAVVDFEWTECGDWHLFCFTWTLNSLQVFVDGKLRRLLSWSPAGYSDEPNPLKVPTFPPSSSKEMSLRVSVGGLRVEKHLFEQAVRRVTNRMGELKKNSQDVDVESLLDRELTVLQLFKSRVKSFSGSMGDLILAEGVISTDWMISSLMVGPQSIDISGMKILSQLNTAQMLAFQSNQVMSQSSDSGRSDDAIAQQNQSFRAKSACLDESRTKGGAAVEDEKQFGLLSNSSSSRFTIFSSTQKDLDRAELLGAVQLHGTATVADTLESIGGLKIWFPLLVTDRARQVARYE